MKTMALGDPYAILGVKKTASDDDIRKAYRNLAKKHHPDLNQGNKAAEQRFKEISAAYDLLGDTQKRARYDRGEIDAEGHEKASAFGGGPWGQSSRSGRGTRQTHGASFQFGDDLGGMFQSFFGQGGGSPFPNEVRADISVEFEDATRGSVQKIRLSSGQILNVTLPAGTADGQTLRVRGQAPGGGDLVLTVKVLPHPYFKREGDHILLNCPVTLSEAVLGGKIRVPTLTGWVEVNIPKNSNTGAVLRLRGKGVGPSGDQRLTLQVALPDEPDGELEAFVRQWSGGHAYNPRKHWKS